MLDERTPGVKLGLALLIAFLLSFPLFAVWLLVYDRQQQSEHAQASIAEGWGGAQAVSGPLLVIPYEEPVTETVLEGERRVTRTRNVRRELTLAPELAAIETRVRPEPRSRSIYEVVLYDAALDGRARFALPEDLARFGVTPEQLDLTAAELLFGLSDVRGLGANPLVTAGGQPLRLQPGGAGFFAWIDASALAQGPLTIHYAFSFRGNRTLGLAPDAGETRWRLTSSWPHPSFQGSFLPAEREVDESGFVALYRIGNLALGRSLVATGGEEGEPRRPPPIVRTDGGAAPPAIAHGGDLAQVSLIEPVDLYSRVNRSAKYGFLFIGFTFLAFLLFDVIGGVRVSAVEYLLVGAGLVLFFVLLLAFAEVIGFTLAYIVASGAIAGLNTAYSAAVLKSWRRALYVGALLVALYGVLYVLLSLEDFSLLIGSMMLFTALAAVMYLTRNLDWGARGGSEEPALDLREPAA